MTNDPHPVDEAERAYSRWLGTSHGWASDTHGVYKDGYNAARAEYEQHMAAALSAENLRADGLLRDAQQAAAERDAARAEYEQCMEERAAAFLDPLGGADEREWKVMLGAMLSQRSSWRQRALAAEEREKALEALIRDIEYR